MARNTCAWCRFGDGTHGGGCPREPAIPLSEEAQREKQWDMGNSAGVAGAPYMVDASAAWKLGWMEGDVVKDKIGDR